MKLSTFGTKFTTHSGILSLMDNLGNAPVDALNILLLNIF